MNISVLGVPPQKIGQFRNKGIYTVEDLIKYLPKRYEDFSKPILVKDMLDGQTCSVIGKIEEITVSGGKYLRVKIKDIKNWTMSIVWFNGLEFLQKKLIKGETYIFCGKVNIDAKYKSRQMVSPSYFGTDIEKYKKIMPIYSKIEKMSDEYLQNSINTALTLVEKGEYLEPAILKEFGLMNTRDTIKGIHQPSKMEEIQKAKERLIFDDLFAYGMRIYEGSNKVNKESLFKMPLCNDIRRYLDSLPFDLTDGQRQVLRKLYKNMRDGVRVDALVQADVGSGKTIVAFILQMIASENGFQSVLMAPTTVLAKQHYEELKESGEKMGYTVGLLYSELSTKEKKKILADIKSGKIDMLVSTHSVLSDNVEFNNLALIIIDEEHRFGVDQRNKIKSKGIEGVHSIVMSATPIPRTLAMVIYGQAIDVYTITSRPKGRKPIITSAVKNEEEAYAFMLNEMKAGRQCYVICPLVEGSDKLQGIGSVKQTYSEVVKYFKKYPEIKIGVIHGKMKQKEIDEEIGKFSKNEYQIIISTTVIEVGVNVPNSTVIVIKNADRFGLSQQHQLRGRVGRGIDQSYCILVSDKLEDEKIRAMCSTTNGFEIAEIDLKLRGTGDFIGTSQTGNNKFVMLMLAYPELFSRIQKLVERIYEKPHVFQKYKFLTSKEVEHD